jgi:hypothetical protein
VLAGCVLIWIPAAFVMDALDGDQMNGRMWRIWSDGPFYFAVLLCTVMAAGYVVFVKLCHRYLWPQYRDVVQELQILVPKTTPRFGEIVNRCGAHCVPCFFWCLGALVLHEQGLCAAVCVCCAVLCSIYEWPFLSQLSAYLAQQRARAVSEIAVLAVHVSRLMARDFNRAELGLPRLYDAEVQQLMAARRALGATDDVIDSR